MFAPFLGSPDDGKARGEPIDRGARIVRDRQGVLRAAIGRAARLPAMTASRRLVSVYNGGQMPDQPDHIFLTHPVELDGAEAEGGPSSPNVDTSATIPVVVLRDSPQVGDLLVASSVGGRWVAERTGGHTTVCVSVCGGIPGRGRDGQRLRERRPRGLMHDRNEWLLHHPAVGHLSRPDCGERTDRLQRHPDPSPWRDHDDRPERQCHGRLLRRLRDPRDPHAHGCGGLAVFRVLPEFLLSHLVRWPCRPASLVLRHDAEQYLRGRTREPGAGASLLSDDLLRGPDPTFAIQRSWSWVYQPGTLTPIWYQDPSGFVAGQPCTTGPPAMCGSPHTDVSTDAKNPTTTSPFAISFNPTPAVSNYTSDPVGGTVAIS